MTTETAGYTESTLAATDGHRIPLRTWTPPSRPEAVIQVLHGMGEHGRRYERFARAAVARRYALAVHDHRGHGQDGERPVHVADSGGWQRLVDDAGIVTAALTESFPGRPLVLLGHSMGSFVAEHLAMAAGRLYTGLLLSASTWPRRLAIAPGMLVARFESRRLGPRASSPLLQAMGFSSFNRRFDPARTEFDWLSRDTAEVDRYVADPLCGGPFSTAFWRDLLDGLWTLGSKRSLERIPADLPILIAGGSNDPVGGEAGLTRLARHYARTGHGRVRLRIYAGGRHEMLNETNRDSVTAEWLDWIAATTRSARAG